MDEVTLLVSHIFFHANPITKCNLSFYYNTECSLIQGASLYYEYKDFYLRKSCKPFDKLTKVLELHEIRCIIITIYFLILVDHSRVKLTPIYDDASSDYINANYISVSILMTFV